MARGTVLDLENTLQPDNLASNISNLWNKWNSAREPWLLQKKELRNYIFATDTTTTSNKQLPWFNSTTFPKITQIRDNLHANYHAALFPSSNFLKWEGDSPDDNTERKRTAITAYMKNKMRQSGTIDTLSQQIYDYIDWGLVVGKVGFKQEFNKQPDGTVIPGYIGPILERISPFDIVFNPTAESFEASPKIIREIKSMGDVAKEVKNGNDPALQTLWKRLRENRKAVSGVSDNQIKKSDGYIADGFSSISAYYQSGFVEFLTFYGSIYDEANDNFLENRIIKIVDRAYIWSDKPFDSWLGNDGIYATGWRPRPDNLYPMGPLDNLVGLQYRLDHLENMKADVFDQIAFPPLKVRGDVEDFEWAPGARIYLGEGDVDFLHPDTTALNADFQIDILERRMEELAGAPRQAMGIRTPGEKTAFEVQTLQNSAGRIFEHKAAHFERTYVEKVVNGMLEVARRNMKIADVVRTFDDDTGATLFLTVTPEDIASKGKIVPIGARHFAERALRLQNLATIVQIKADPTIGVHLSGKEIARIIAEELDEPGLYGENIAISEQQETARFTEEASVVLQTEQAQAADIGLI